MRLMKSLFAVFAVSAVGGLWASAVARAYRFGIYESDSLRYHLPLAATFAQQHSITALHFFELDHLATTAPSNTEL